LGKLSKVKQTVLDTDLETARLLSSKLTGVKKEYRQSSLSKVPNIAAKN